MKFQQIDEDELLEGATAEDLEMEFVNRLCEDEILARKFFVVEIISKCHTGKLFLCKKFIQQN